MLDIIIAVFLAISAFTLGESKGRKKQLKLMNGESHPKASKTPSSARKLSKDKDALDIMKELDNHTELFEDFKIIESSKGKTKYKYLENGYLFTVIRIPKVGATIIISKEKQELLNYTYYFSTSYSNARYTKQEIARSLIENHPRDEAMDTINSFVKTVIHNHTIWNRMDTTIVITDDVKEVKPVYDASMIKPKEEINEEESVSDNLSRLQQVITDTKEDLNPAVFDMFQSIIQNMRNCLTHIDRLETEKQYSLETLLQKDLEKLFIAYNELNQNSKEEVADKVLKALSILDEEILYVLDVFEKQNIREVEKMVQVIEAREY